MKSFSDYITEQEREILNRLFDLREELLGEAFYTVANRSQPWGDLKIPYNAPQELVLKLGHELYQKAREFAEKASGKFVRELQKFAQGGKLIWNIKPERSFLEKIMDRGRKASQIHDMLRAAILLPTKEDADDAVEQMRKRLQIVEYDYKGSAATNEFGYYGSHHIDVLVDPPGVVAEVQVMHRKLWVYKGPAHDIYNKLRNPNSVISPEEKKRDLAYSRDLFRKGNK